MKTLKYFWRTLSPVIATILLLEGCANNMPQPDPADAWVGLKEDPSTTLMAEKLDGKRLDDGRFFEVPAGKHRLEAILYTDGAGDNSGETCRADLNYGKFTKGANYKLVESSLGQNYTITLYDNNGNDLAHTSKLDCLPG